MRDSARGEGAGGAEVVLDLIRTRRSIRHYRPDPVPDDLLTAALEAARWAPSAVNSQPWHFVVVTDQAGKDLLAKNARFAAVFRWKHLATAPVVVGVVGDPRNNRFFTIDCALAGANLMLAAHALGLGTCWVGGFGQGPIKRILGVPAFLEVVGLITLGYPDHVPGPPPRLPLEKLVSREVYDPSGAANRLERLRLSGLYSLRKRIGILLGMKPRK